MGYALAAAALASGADVTLISGPVDLLPPLGSTFVPVETTQEMQRAVDETTRTADVLIMAAAVADFRPESRSSHKIKKEPDGASLSLRLVRNPDILADLDRPHLLKVGFAAETEDLLENAKRKLAAKKLDVIVGNDAAATIGASDSEAIILTASGDITALPRMSKEALATEIVWTITRLLYDAERHDA
jgi:phosphopantothenoylcysteine decarboxylase/phosphopantothenate--cysteine ligase